MKIIQHPVKVSELVQGYEDRGEAGVVAYDERLDVRPPYQREFVYNAAQQKAVIDTVMRGLPLNVFYWAERHPDPQDGNQAEYEMMDGQQRTISICRFVDGEYSIDDPADGRPKYFHSLPSDVQQHILDYELLVYVADGTDSQKLDWFKTINIAGERLTDQELRNAVYTGPWLTDAKKHFSRTGGAAYQLGQDYVRGTPIRQELLQLALEWIMARDKPKYGSIEEVMSERQHWANAQDTWGYYQQVLNWARNMFPTKRKELKQVNWQALYHDHHQRNDLNAADLEKQISTLMADEDVTRKAGAYEYVLNGSQRALSIRAFPDRDKRAAYEQQKGICPGCDEHFEYAQMHGDHKLPWSKGGKTIPENCQMLCRDCNLEKTDI